MLPYVILNHTPYNTTTNTNLNQSIFSMSMFNWGAGEGETVVSNYIWLFLVLSLGLTGMTVLAWRLGTRHIEVSATKEQEKRGSRGVECNNV